MDDHPAAPDPGQREGQEESLEEAAGGPPNQSAPGSDIPDPETSAAPDPLEAGSPERARDSGAPNEGAPGHAPDAA